LDVDFPYPGLKAYNENYKLKITPRKIAVFFAAASTRLKIASPTWSRTTRFCW